MRRMIPDVSTAVDPALLDDARALLPEIVELRRDLHRIPEVGLELPLTQERLLRALDGLPLVDVRRGQRIGSVTAVMEGERPGPTVLLRADMDALPLQEETGLDFSSQADGSMHACGHDTHVAMLVGAARILAGRRDRLAGRVLFMFQPGEEGYHGARVMIEEGLLDGPELPSAAFAIHIAARHRSGTINVRPGPLLAAGDTIRITVRGAGGHASAPHLAVDPIAVAAEVVVALQSMVTRTADIFDPAVLTIANITAGTTTNIIPETAFMQGTMRTLSDATRERMRANVVRVAEHVALAHGATAEVELEPGYPVTVNDPAFAAHVASVAAGLLGPDAVEELAAPIMGAEDFSYVLERVPGAMAFLGAALPEYEPGEGPQGHSNRVVFHEPAMVAGMATYAAVALAEADRR